MQCSGCGNKEAYRLSYSPSKDGGKSESCDKCGASSGFKFSDVFFKGEYFDPHIAHPEKSPKGNLIRSREHKAALMREIGITECGDKRHGSLY